MLELNTISTTNGLKTIPQEKIEFIRNEALKLDYATKHLQSYDDKSHKNQIINLRIMEIIYKIGTFSFGGKVSNYKTFTSDEKNLLAALAAYNDKEDLIVSALASQNINLATLAYNLRLIDKMKQNPQINTDLTNFINTMRYISITYFGIDDYTLILTKISEMLLYQKELFKTSSKRR